MIEMRWVTPADIDAFYGARPPQTVRALALVEEGKVIAIGGLTSEKQYAVAFIDLKPEARKHKKALVRAMRTAYERLVQNSKQPIIAIADPNEPTAAGLLEHFGFEHIGESEYQWRK